MLMRIAHFSDPHIAPLPRPTLAELASKRLTGFINWHAARKRASSPGVLEALLADIAAHDPDHMCLTGDLVNLGLESEYPLAGSLLHRIAPAERLSVVPGNHDAYLRGALDHARLHWHNYMTGDDGALTFPYLRRRGPVAFIGLSTAVPTLPFRATGTLGAGQIERCRSLLRQTAAEGLFRLVMIHHPPVAGLVKAGKALIDQAEFADMLAQEGAGLILHGHSHRGTTSQLPGPSQPINVYGVASASALFPKRHAAKPGAGWTLFEIGRHQNGWQMRAIRRTLQLDANGQCGFATLSDTTRPVSS